MWPGDKSSKIVFLLVLLLLSCNGGEEKLYRVLESYNPVEGTWENKNYTRGRTDTVITIYKFLADSRFESGQSRFRNGQYEDTLYEGGSYSIPVASLLLLSYEYKRQGNNHYTPVSSNDTLVFTKDGFIELILWGSARSFKQIGGEPGKLRPGTYYNVKKHFDAYAHSKLEFKEDSAYFYSVFTPEMEEPREWPEPFKYRIEISGALITFYTNDGRATSNGYALYKSNLIFTYTQQKYRYQY